MNRILGLLLILAAVQIPADARRNQNVDVNLMRLYQISFQQIDGGRARVEAAMPGMEDALVESGTVRFRVVVPGPKGSTGLILDYATRSAAESAAAAIRFHAFTHVAPLPTVGPVRAYFFLTRGMVPVLLPPRAQSRALATARFISAGAGEPYRLDDSGIELAQRSTAQAFNRLLAQQGVNAVSLALDRGVTGHQNVYFWRAGGALGQP